jgi:hypothetical protein
VDPRHWLARNAGRAVLDTILAAADRVVEHHHATGPGRLLHQFLGLRVVDRVKLSLIVEIGYRRRRIHQHKTLPIEGQPVGDRAHVEDRDGVGLVDDIRPRHATRRVIGVCVRLIRGPRQIHDLSGHLRQRRNDVHDALSSLFTG